MAVNDKEKEDPSTTSSAYDMMAPRWHMIETLLGGTEAMRDAGEDFLPRHERERGTAYDERLSRTVLMNMIEVTLDLLAGKPFVEPIQINDADPRIIEWSEDIDLQGNDINRFGYEVFRTAFAKGFTHILVDAPEANPEIKTLADAREANIRPYFVHIAPENLIFAEAVRINGVETLTHIRFREFETTRDGFAEVVEEYIRVLELDEVPIEDANTGEEIGTQLRMTSVRYKPSTDKKKKGGWEEVEGTFTVTELDRIPLMTFYTIRDGLMLSKPPLLDLAYLNVEHWQSYSDQINIMTVCRFPLLGASGVDEEEMENLIVGPKELLATLDPAGRFYYIEHSGAAIESGRKHLEDLERRMAVYGASLLVKRPDRETAQARDKSEANVTSPLRRMTLGFVDVMQTLFEIMGDMGGIENVGTIDMKTNFDADTTDAVELQTLQVAYKDNAISRVTFINELKRRGIIGEDVDPDKEMDLLKAEIALREAITKAMKGSSESEDGNGEGEEAEGDGDVRRSSAGGTGTTNTGEEA